MGVLRDVMAFNDAQTSKRADPNAGDSGSADKGDLSGPAESGGNQPGGALMDIYRQFRRKRAGSKRE